MLSGDPIFSNPVFTVSTKDPSALNEKPTINTLIDDVKILNGVGNVDNSVLSEQWSSRVASALFEHEQMIEISSMSEFDLVNYPEPTSKLATGLKAVAGFMKSRAFRKVNREVYVVSDNGYDMHNADELAVKFQGGEWTYLFYITVQLKTSHTHSFCHFYFSLHKMTQQ